MRLFVALEIPAVVREKLAALLGDLRAIDEGPRWVRPENLHVTLKFIGEVSQEKLREIQPALAAVRANSEVKLELRGLGFFPAEKRPRVFWVGMQASANLATLARDIDAALGETGIPRETREFSPHLTLARINDGNLSEKLRAAIRERSAAEFGTIETSEFHLVESKLRRGGAEYTRVESFRFFDTEG